MGGEFVTMRTILVRQPHIIFPLGVHNLNSMVVRVPTHVPALGAHLSTVGIQAFTYRACSLFRKTLALLGLGILREYFTCVIPECTKHTTSPFSLTIPYTCWVYEWTSTHTYLRPTYVAHYHDQTTELTCLTQDPMTDHRALSPTLWFSTWTFTVT